MGEDGSNRGIQKVQTLHRNANYFREKLMEMGLDTLGDWDSPVIVSHEAIVIHWVMPCLSVLQPIMLYAPGKVPFLSRECFRRNVAVVVVDFPATALASGRARICISASHSMQDLDHGLDVRILSCGQH